MIQYDQPILLFILLQGGKMKKTQKALLVISVTGFIMTAPLIPAFATSPGGSDSCGLGWQVIQSKSLSATSTRGTTNSFVPPTLGMTSGTIGCDAHPIAAKDVPAARYVATNFDILKHEVAMGQGEILLGFSQVMGCSPNQARGFTQTLKANYVDVFPHGQITPVEMFKNVQKLTGDQCLVF